MKYSKPFKMQASICEVDKLVDLVRFIYDIHKKDRGHFNKPDIKIENINDEVVSCKTIKELENTLRQSFKFIRGMNFEYWGKSQMIEIRINKWSKNISVNLSSEKEGSILKNEKYIRDIFSAKSWNSYSMFAIMFLHIVLIAALLISIVLKIQVSKESFLLLFYVLVGPSYWIADWLSSFYPVLILINDEKQSGRILKKDIWFMILTLIIPFIINKI